MPATALSMEHHDNDKDDCLLQTWLGTVGTEPRLHTRNGLYKHMSVLPTNNIAFGNCTSASVHKLPL